MGAHTTRVVPDDCAGVGGDVVEEMRDYFLCFICGGGLFGVYCAEGNNHCVVDCSGMIEDSPTIYCIFMISSGGRMGSFDSIGVY